MNTDLQDRTTDNKTDVRLLSLRDASTYMSLSYFTLRDMCLRGELPHLRAGRKYLLDIQDLDAWISMNKERFVA